MTHGTERVLDDIRARFTEIVKVYEENKRYMRVAVNFFADNDTKVYATEQLPATLDAIAAALDELEALKAVCEPANLTLI